MAAKRSPLVKYACGLCRKPCEGLEPSPLALLQLCSGCQEKRFAAGMAAQKRADQAVARG
jgi:hypothetical protein